MPASKGSNPTDAKAVDKTVVFPARLVWHRSKSDAGMLIGLFEPIIIFQ
jgi:hypothetical protein